MLHKLGKYIPFGSTRTTSPKEEPAARSGPLAGPDRKAAPPGSPVSGVRENKQREGMQGQPPSPARKLTDRVANRSSPRAIAQPSPRTHRAAQMLDALARGDLNNGMNHLDELWALHVKSAGELEAPAALRGQLRQALANRNPLDVARAHRTFPPHAPGTEAAMQDRAAAAKDVLRECLAEFNAAAGLFVRPTGQRHRPPTFAELRQLVAGDLAATGRMLRWVETQGMGLQAGTPPALPGEVTLLLAGEAVDPDSLRTLVQEHRLDLRGCTTTQLQRLHESLALLEVHDAEASFVRALCWRGIALQREFVADQLQHARARVREAIAQLQHPKPERHARALANLEAACLAIGHAYAAECLLASAAGLAAPAKDRYEAARCLEVIGQAWNTWAIEHAGRYRKIKDPGLVALLEGVMDQETGALREMGEQPIPLAQVRAMLFQIIAISRDAEGVTTRTELPSASPRGKLAVSQALADGLGVSVSEVSSEQLAALRDNLDKVFASMDSGFAGLPVADFGLTGQAIKDMPRARYAVRVGTADRVGLRVSQDRERVEIFQLDRPGEVVARVGRDDGPLSEHLGVEPQLLRRAMHFSNQETIAAVEQFLHQSPLSPLSRAFGATGYAMLGGERLEYDLTFKEGAARLHVDYTRDRVTRIASPLVMQHTDPSRTFLRTSFALDLAPGKPTRLDPDSVQVDFQIESAPDPDDTQAE